MTVRYWKDSRLDAYRYALSTTAPISCRDLVDYRRVRQWQVGSTHYELCELTARKLRHLSALLETAPEGNRFLVFSQPYLAHDSELDQLLLTMAKGPEKRLVGAETAELYRIMGRLDRALQLYRNNHDFAGEFEVLFAMGSVQEAVTVAGLVKYARGEADALMQLGRVDEALRIYEEKGLVKERWMASLIFSSWEASHMTMKNAIMAVTKSAYATFHDPP